MSFRLPDTFHRPGVALVRVGPFVKVALATNAKPVTVTVGKLRVPEAIASLAEGQEAVFVGAFLTEPNDRSVCPDPKGLAETVRREAERLTGREVCAGDYVRIDEHALDTLVGLMEGKGASLVRYGGPVSYRTSSYTPDLPDDIRRASRTAPSVSPPPAYTGGTSGLGIKPAEKRLDTLVSAAEARAIREQKERETELAENRIRMRAAARGSSGSHSSPSESFAPGSGRPGAKLPKSRTYTAARTAIRKQRERATRKQFDYLLSLGATVDVSLEDFTHRVSKRDATSAIDTQKAGVRHVTITY